MHTLPRLVLLCLPLLAPGPLFAAAGDPPATSAVDSVEFARLKTLVGTWLLLDESGKPTGTVASVFSIIAGGHSIRETMFPGTPEEMVNMYYRNGPATEMVHYCSTGNQPRLDIRSPAPDVLALEFIDATNLSSPDAEHMHSARYILEGPDRMRTEWMGWKGGKLSDTTVFHLVRQPRDPAAAP